MKTELILLILKKNDLLLLKVMMLGVLLMLPSGCCLEELFQILIEFDFMGALNIPFL
jgi:hypothetical protein